MVLKTMFLLKEEKERKQKYFVINEQVQENINFQSLIFLRKN